MLKVKDVRILRKGSLPGMAAISFDSQTHCYHICCYGPSSTSSSHKCFHLYPVLRKHTTSKKIVRLLDGAFETIVTVKCSLRLLC